MPCISGLVSNIIYLIKDSASTSVKGWHTKIECLALLGQRTQLMVTMTWWKDDNEFTLGKKSQTLGRRKKFYSLYHPCCNSPLERSSKTVKLYARVDEENIKSLTNDSLSSLDEKQFYYPQNVGHYFPLSVTNQQNDPLQKSLTLVWPFVAPNARVLLIDPLLSVTQPVTWFTSLKS